MDDLADCDRVASRAVGMADGHRAQREALTGILNSGPFRPGQLFELMEEQNIELTMSRQDFIDLVAATCNVAPHGTFSTGYWADHWTYYLDMIETYVSIYPDWEGRIMYEESLPYFFSPAFVKPRSEKYVLSTTFDGMGKHIRQLEATEQTDEEKVAYQKNFIQESSGWFSYAANWQHDAKGRIIRSPPIAKLFLLATLKFASRDAYGMGVEYEGGKPGWNDANNGLVGMLGSGMPETYELLALLKYILRTCSRFNDRVIRVPSELNTLVDAINAAVGILSAASYDGPPQTKVPEPLFQYWDAVATARENYRQATKITVSGDIVEIRPDLAAHTLELWIKQVEEGIKRALQFGSEGFNDNGTSRVTPTYFAYDVTKWKETGGLSSDGHPFVTASGMEVKRLPLFLEGPTRMMKTVDNGDALAIYRNVHSSALRDRALGMYTISASLQGQGLDMGREMAFAAGWLENQSVWLHLSYK